jgi:hypothetical protein
MKKHSCFGRSAFFIPYGIEPIQIQQPGGLLIAGGLTTATP